MRRVAAIIMLAIVLALAAWNGTRIGCEPAPLPGMPYPNVIQVPIEVRCGS